ncbi:hypothetical protein IL992_29550 [Microbispora sp. NEAU-D428]|uniref:hypothetical protein n=1 Tax=Microbispora sitophila TaxID=2771537 RepID=UPI00186889E2|nr:hypothetical protein [Microbispora sitophila]MBE3013297.1 hypothetical protein [Microbispora sitophila]
MLRLYGVSASDLSAFATYLAVGLTLPGMLLIRCLYRGRRTLVEEIALGLALGYAIEVPAYIAARAAGLPLLVLAFPVGTYTLFLVVPRLRGHWKGGPRRASPLWWSWSIALVIVYLVVWSAATFFRANALTWPALALSHVDTPFHLSLIGELKHHLPPTVPAVAGEPLLYHWFVHAELAATSWVTGVEPVVLLLRLAMLPMLAALVVLVGVIALRVLESRPAALTAVLAALFMAAPSLHLGSNGVFTWGGIQDAAWISPSQTFGGVLFAPAVLLLIDILEDTDALGARRLGRWLLLAVFLVAVMGAKATYLPLLATGIAAVAGVEAMRRRRPPRPALIALGMTVTCLLFAQAVLFRGARQGLDFSPSSVSLHLWKEFTGRSDGPPPAAVIGLSFLFLACWLFTWSGVLGLLGRPRLLMRPAIVVMTGMGTAGLGAALLLGNIHLNQLYFLRATYPYMAVVTVYGLVTAVRGSRASPLTVAGAAGLGVAAAYLIPLCCGVEIPLAPGRPPALVYLPYIALAAVLLPAGIVLIVRRGRAGWALTLSMVAAIGLPAEAHARILAIVQGIAGARTEALAGPVTEPSVPRGALAAARWLRGHSNPDDLVATNDHVRWADPNSCDSRHSWVSALTERRVLVEGWAYTAKNWDRLRPGQGPECTRFWDIARLRSNDAAFLTPSPESIRRLWTDYGVRWLFSDERHAGQMARYATVRFRSGDTAVYQIHG